MDWERRRKESLPGNWCSMSKIRRIWGVFREK